MPPEATGRALISRAIDHLIPAQVRDEVERRRARVLVVSALIGVLATLPSLLLRWWSGASSVEIAIHLLALGSLGAAPFLLRVTASVRLASVYLSASSLALTFVAALAFVELDFSFAIAGWFTVITLIAVFLLGPRAGAVVAAASMAGTGFLFWLRATGRAPLASLVTPESLERFGVDQVLVISALNVELTIATVSVMAFAYGRELQRESSALRRSERELRRLTDTLAVGVFVTREGLIVHANAAAAQLLASPVETLLGRAFVATVGLKVGGAALRVTSDNVKIRESSFEDAQGRARFVEIASLPIEWAGEPGILHTAVDLTERKWEAEERARLEAQLRHTQKLETIGLLAGGIAHDFNNILQTILANTELLQAPTAEVDPAPSGRRLERIRLAATRGAELVEQMLAYAGRGKAKIEELEVSEIVREVVSLASAAMSKKANLRLELMEGLPPVSGDPTQVRQVVMNLVTNAADAVGDEVGAVVVRSGSVVIDEDGQLELRAPRQTFVAGELAPGRYVYFEVEDDGCGIAPEEIPRIFDPFYTTKTHGRGLGLAAVLGIVSSHGGTLEVESRANEGSRFRCYLPALPGVAPRARVASEGLHARPRQARILLADDDEDIAISVQESLRALGYAVTTVPDGTAAVDAVREASVPFDLVILDMAMPRMDGAEALEAIHRHAPALPAILATGYAHGHERADLASLGFVDMLRKPYRGRDLVRAIDRILDHPRPPE